jgi:hypothetical protein
MADEIRATPRSPLFGLFSDIVNVPLDYMSDPRRTQQMQGVASFIRGTGVPSTLQNLSYDPSGRGLFTGAGGLGGTTRMRPEVIEAALTVAPMVGPVARMTRGLPVGMSIKGVGKIDELTGLPLNSDGTVTLFHHTNKTAAEQISKTGRLKSAGEPNVYLTTRKTTDTGYGDVAVPVRVKPDLLNLDDEFPDGRLDFSIDTGKPKGSIPVTIEPQSFQAPQDEALLLAQQRAALPVEQGGLGLAADNMAAQRATAMGFDVENPMYHATDVDFTSIRPSTRGKLGAGVYVSPSSRYAEKYTNENARVLPLVTRGNLADDDAAMNIAESVRQELVSKSPNFSVQEWKQKTTQALENAGYDGRNMSGLESVIFNPENIRSRFAAFDPFRRNAAIAAAMGVAAPNLLANEVNYPANPMYEDPFGFSIR